MIGSEFSGVRGEVGRYEHRLLGKRENMSFTLERAPGFGNEFIVRILTDELARQIWLVPDYGESCRDFGGERDGWRGLFDWVGERKLSKLDQFCRM